MLVSGTTLIETVVALLVVSLVAAALSTSTGAALRSEAAAGRRERGAALAVEGLEELIAAPLETLRPGTAIETILDGDESFERERIVAAGPAPGLWRLTVVTRPNRGGPVSISTLRHAPWVGP